MKFACITILLGGWTLAQQLPPPVPPPSSDDPMPVFGVSVFVSGGLTGQIYKLKPNSTELPDFKKMKPIGTIYTQSLAIPQREFSEGFPGVSDVFEWFAIDYNGSFWIDEPGEYRFFLASDDGSRLYIDGKKVVDNNGVHPPEMRDGKVKLKQGSHRMNVQYFQGPRYHVALMLEVVPPDGRRRIFSTKEFKPPADLFDTDLKQPAQ